MFLFTLAHASEREYPRYCNPPAYHCCGPAFRVGARGKEVIKREHMYSMHSLITLTATIIVGRQPCTEPCTCTCFFLRYGLCNMLFFYGTFSWELFIIFVQNAAQRGEQLSWRRGGCGSGDG